MNWNPTGCLLILFLLSIASCSSQSAGATPQTAAYDQYRDKVEKYVLGDAAVSIVFHEFDDSPSLFFNMHDDENTSIEAAKKVLAETGGSLLHLEHRGERLIEFALEDTLYRFDPNRMFTETGARLSLLRYGPFSTEALQVVRTFAQYLVDFYRFEDRPVIITLHNNTEGTYSAEGYLPDGEYADDAKEVFIESGSDPDDFFFVTEFELFRFFKKEGFNVVLQDNEQVTDDGSLSVLAGRAGLPYVNVEAQHEHLEKQKEMLRVLQRLLSLIQSPDE